MNGFINGLCKTTEKAHTKVGDCTMFEGTPYGFLVHEKGNSFSMDETTFNTELQAALTAEVSSRITPLLGGITDYQVTGGDVNTSQEGFGPEVPIGINAKRVDYIINKGGLSLLRQLKKLNGREIRIFPVDVNKVAYGTTALAEGKEVFRGFLATLYATKRDNTGTQTGAIILSVFYSADYETEENQLAANPIHNELEGLTGVVLRKTASGKAKFVIAYSGDDLTEIYGATLAAPELYENTLGKNPTTVTYNEDSKDLTFVPTGSYRIKDAATLKQADIDAVEGEETYTDLA